MIADPLQGIEQFGSGLWKVADSLRAAGFDPLLIHLPTPPFTEAEKNRAADTVYAPVWLQAVRGGYGPHA